MGLQLAMRLSNHVQAPFLLILLIPLLLFITITYATFHRAASLVDIRQVWRAAMKKSMNQTHVFIPANHTNIHYSGRWIPFADGLRRDAAFPGSYLEFAITNTTSLSIVLDNIYMDLDKTIRYQYPVHQHFNKDIASSALQVSILVEIEGDRILGIERAASVVQIADDLNPSKTYRVRITHIGDPYATCTALQFEGVWLDRPALRVNGVATIRSACDRTLGVLSPPTQRLNNNAQNNIEAALRRAPVIEIVTSETSGYLANANTENLEPFTHQKLKMWYNILGKALRTDIALVPVAEGGLLYPQNDLMTIPHIFFRSGPKESAYGGHQWSFGTYKPSILILQLGLTDFVEFFNEKSNANKEAVRKFTDKFVKATVQFVRTIRSSAYPFHAQTDSMNDNDDSYIYNSAPSTLPIFLLTPFSARHRFVTRRLTLHKFISDALAQAASTLQAQGDKSTFWIDTSGWLDPREDFNRLYDGYHKSTEANPLTKEGDVKVANLLADYLCPWINTAERVAHSSPADAFGVCAFDSHEHYLGDVYLPQDVEFDRAVLERKIETIKQALNMGGAFEREGRHFLHMLKP